MQSPFDKPAIASVPTEGHVSGTRGGHDLSGAAGGSSMSGCPYDQPAIRSVGPKETPGGVIPNQPTITRLAGDTPPAVGDINSYTANRTWPASRK